MSRVGKKPILIPEDVEVKINGQEITVKGPKGELVREIRPEIKVEQKQGQIFLSPQARTKQTKAFWGLSRSLVFNMLQGVKQGYQKKLQIKGVGYRARVEAKDLVLEVGFSHPVKITSPNDIDFLVEKDIITISGIDKEKVGQMAAKVRAVRPPEPYKGKGIRHVDEKVRRKEGKKAAGVTT